MTPAVQNGVGKYMPFATAAAAIAALSAMIIITIVIIIIIRNLYSAIMPLGGYRGAGGTGRLTVSRKQ